MELSRRAFAGGLALAAGVGGKASAAGIDDPIAGYLRDGAGPGASVAVMRQGKVLLARGYGLGNLETRTPVTADSVFRAGSITKQFTAAAIMLLAEEGRLSVGDLLARHLPELKAAEGVTLRMALNHTSGIRTYTNEAFQPQVRLPHSSQQMVDFIAGQTPLLEFAPGTQWRYSNSNFHLLGLVVERLSGKSLRDFLAERVFPRAGLTVTALDREEDVVAGRANGYAPLPGGKGAFRNADFISMDPPGGAGALRSTPLELVRWHDALLSGRVVNAASLAAMTTPDKAAVREASPATGARAGYGFGLEIGELEGEPTVGHGGGIPGFASYLVTFPRLHLSVAAMFNGEPSGREPFGAIGRAVLQTFRPAGKERS